jgi:hypothetical protein
VIWRRRERINMNMRHLIAIATLIAAGPARCILAHPESPFVQGYVAGLKDGMFMQFNFKTVDGVTWAVFLVSGEKACVPMNLPVGFETLVSPVRDYLLAQPPNQETWPFVSLMPKAFSQAYPCPSSLGRE